VRELVEDLGDEPPPFDTSRVPRDAVNGQHHEGVSVGRIGAGDIA
jgi:hypothetical protein